MCRFSVSNAPPPAPSPELALDTLLAEDDFNWYNAIECLPDEELAEFGEGVCQEGTAARQEADAPAPSSSSSGASGYSEASATTYDLVELFKAQVEQDPAALLANAQAQQLQGYGFAPFQAQPVPQQQVLPTPAACSMSDLKPAAFTAAPMHAALPSGPMPGCSTAVMVPPAPVAAGSYAQMTPSMGLMTPQPPMAPFAGLTVMRKPGSKSQRTQAEVEAAVERIKQKRRESAQRSRARKNDYMRQLEIENQGLKDEVHRLQSMLAAMQRGACMQQPQISPVMGM